jgi:hypothetical protein
MSLATGLRDRVTGGVIAATAASRVSAVATTLWCAPGGISGGWLPPTCSCVECVAAVVVTS